MPAGSRSNEDRVRAEWMDDFTIGAWRRWHAKSAQFSSELTNSLIEVARLEAGQRVLDLASGTGDPGLTIAGRVGPSGHVVMTDLAPAMVDIARENAARAGLGNASGAVADAHQLPYPDASFDRVTCRLGVMYFWDCRAALTEVRRVLKPGGLAAFLAWGPAAENDYMRSALGPFKARKPLPEPAPDAPQPYRFGGRGALTAALVAAGFSGVGEEARTLTLNWPGPPEELWTRLYEVSAPMRPYFDSFAPDERAAAIREAVANLARFHDGVQVATRAAVVLAAATK